MPRSKAPAQTDAQAAPQAGALTDTPADAQSDAKTPSPAKRASRGSKTQGASAQAETHAQTQATDQGEGLATSRAGEAQEQTAASPKRKPSTKRRASTKDSSPDAAEPAPQVEPRVEPQAPIQALPAPPAAAKIYVAGLSWSTDERQLKDLFGVFGAITSIELIRDNYTGQSRGFGFLTFEHEDAARGARVLHGHILDRRPITVDLAIERPSEERRERRNARREVDIKTRAYQPRQRAKTKRQDQKTPR